MTDALMSSEAAKMTYLRALMALFTTSFVTSTKPTTNK
jgi:hypothetical protein